MSGSCRIGSAVTARRIAEQAGVIIVISGMLAVLTIPFLFALPFWPRYNDNDHLLPGIPIVTLAFLGVVIISGLILAISWAVCEIQEDTYWFL